MKSKRLSRRSRLSIEQLEIRQVLSGFQPTAAEQLMLEQINDIRANPAAYGAAIGVNLNGVAPAQPLAFDSSLIEAAQQHSQDMNDRAYFAQTTPDNIDPGQRLTAVGFPWTSWSESLQAGTNYVNSAGVLRSLIIDSGSASLADRTELLALNAVAKTQNQVGIGVIQGGTGPLANYYTIDTAATNDGNPFLTGVVFQDAEGTGHYDIGEGAGNILITATSGSNTYKAATWTSGGFSIEVTPGTYTVTASGGGLVSPVTMTVTVGTSNARANFVLPPGSIQAQASAFVELVYRDVLGRVPAGAEVAGWVNGLNHGLSQGGLATGFLYSLEYSNSLVGQWYQQYLHRSADSSGLSGFAQALQNGASEDAIRTTILTSSEYFALHGNTAQGFVQGLYKDLLGRTPSPSEVGSWVTTALTNRPAAVAGFMQSQEFRNDEVGAFYGTYLRRGADSDGLNHFATLLGQGVDERAVIQSLVGSPEYFNNSQTILWLRSLYQDVLGRNGDNASELGGWLASQPQSGNRAALAVSFVSSPEEAKRVVTALYQLLLNRAPDSSGLGTFASLLQSTGTASAVIVQLASSAEYYAQHLNNDSQFIRGLYQNLLGRGSSDTEVQIWLDELNTGKTRVQVVADFLATTAYQDAHAANVFKLYLQRPPSKMETDQIVSQLQAGASDAAIVAAIIGSDEYYLDAASK